MKDLQELLYKKYGKSHLSASSIKNAGIDMVAFHNYMAGERKESEALKFGSCFDSFLFDGREEWDKKYIIEDDADIINTILKDRPDVKNARGTKEYKVWREANMSGDREIVEKDKFELIEGMYRRLDTTGTINTLLQGEYQQELREDFIKVDDLWVPVKGFYDVINDERKFITDHKTTNIKPYEFSARKFGYRVQSYGYDIQAYVYCQSSGYDDFYWVVSLKDYPFSVGEFKASEDTLHWGHKKFEAYVRKIYMFLVDDRNPYETVVKGEI
jgi:hypothetical protein